MKKIFIIVVFTLLISSYAQSAEKKNCEDKPIINKFLCKTFSKTGIKKPKIPTFGIKKDPLGEVKKKKTLADFFKKKKE